MAFGNLGKFAKSMAGFLKNDVTKLVKNFIHNDSAKDTAKNVIKKLFGATKGGPWANSGSPFASGL